MTLQPASARNYEMPSQCGGESADILWFLMQVPEPSPEIVAAVHAGVAWFEKTAMRDVAFTSAGSGGRRIEYRHGSSLSELGRSG